MKIAIGSDHAGFKLKEAIKAYLEDKGFKVIDKGTFSEASCHYPVFSYLVARAVAEGDADYGILVCKTGIGSAIAANKVKGIRAALCCNKKAAELTRGHNHSNILVLGAEFVPIDDALGIVDVFLNTPEEGGRHNIRVRMISEIESGTIEKDPDFRI